MGEVLRFHCCTPMAILDVKMSPKRMNEILVNEPESLPGKEEEYKRQCGIGMHISVWGRYRNIQSVLLPN